MWGRNNIYEETNELEETYYLSVGRKSSSNLPNPAQMVKPGKFRIGEKYSSLKRKNIKSQKICEQDLMLWKSLVNEGSKEVVKHDS